MKPLHLIALSLILLAGCTTPNPAYVKPLPGQPNTNQVPAFVVDPRLAAYSNSAASMAEALAPANPYAGLTRLGLEFGFGLATIFSAYVSKQKSNALNVMGAGVVKSGSGQAVLDHASSTPYYVAVADSINKATGANQNNTGTPAAS